MPFIGKSLVTSGGQAYCFESQTTDAGRSFYATFYRDNSSDFGGDFYAVRALAKHELLHSLAYDCRGRRDEQRRELHGKRHDRAAFNGDDERGRLFVDRRFLEHHCGHPDAGVSVIDRDVGWKTGDDFVGCPGHRQFCAGGKSEP